jgi:small subunit ribosomal protein S4
MVKARLRKKYSGPSHLWQMARIKEEAKLRKDYGYKNKKELWKVVSVLRNFRAQARKLIPLTNKQAILERRQLIDRLKLLGLVKEDAKIENVLALNIHDLLERRLQTLVYRKKLANTISQARQFITHRHISVNGMKVTSPSMLVKVGDEPYISFSGTSAMVNEMHPERVAGKERRDKLHKKESIEEKMRVVKEAEKAVKEAEKEKAKEKEEEKKLERELKEAEGEIVKEVEV